MAEFRAKNGYGNTAGCPKVSSERFEELVTLYLDKEATKEELVFLSRLIRSDEEARAVFEKSCKIHLATCRMFGKTCVLTKLPGMHMPRRKRISRRRAAFEWTAVAALMFLSFVLFQAANVPLPEDSAHAQADMGLLAGVEKDLNMSVSENFVPQGGNTCSIFSIDSKK